MSGKKEKSSGRKEKRQETLVEKNTKICSFCHSLD